QHSAESGSLSYGPPVRLRLLSTSPHGDAVTFDYEVMACLDADLHRADVMPSRAHGLRPPPERRRYVAQLARAIVLQRERALPLRSKAAARLAFANFQFTKCFMNALT